MPSDLDLMGCAEDDENAPDYIIDNQIDFMSVCLDNEIHVSKKFEKEFWIYMVFTVNTLESEQEYLQDLQFFPEAAQRRCVENFYDNWFLFYGKFEGYLEEGEFSVKFLTLWDEYVQSYFFGDFGKKIPQNILDNVDKYPKVDTEGSENAEVEDKLKFSTLVSRFAVTGLPKFSLTRYLFP